MIAIVHFHSSVDSKEGRQEKFSWLTVLKSETNKNEDEFEIFDVSGSHISITRARVLNISLIDFLP